MATINLTYVNDAGDEITLTLPAVMEVCDDCQGEGYVLCEGMREYAYSYESFMEEFDCEEQQEYFKRGGMYDVVCSTCHGKNVIPVIDEEHIPANMLSQYKEWQEYDERMARYEAEDRATARMERLMGC